MNNKYDDIINLKHHISKNHQQMTMENRASQFSPFSALEGYETSIIETTREVDKKINLCEEDENILNNKIKILDDNIKLKYDVKIKYFIKDSFKDGGEYLWVIDKIRKIDKVNREIILENKQRIKIDDIINIESVLFNIENGGNYE